MLYTIEKETAMFIDIYFVYLLSGLILLPCMILSIWASAKVHTTFNKYSQMPTSSNWSGSDTARMLLERNNAYGIEVVRGKGKLTDHFNPKTMTVSLSQSTYDSTSVAAVAVSAHEIGHVVQREEGYAFYRLRTALVPITNVGTMLAFPLVIVGVLLTWIAALTEVGNIIVFIGVCLYGLSTLFSLITLPVELNASARAKRMLAETGVLVSDEEKRAASKVLSAAAMTYVAALLTSLLLFFRFLLYVLVLTGGRKRR